LRVSLGLRRDGLATRPLVIPGRTSVPAGLAAASVGRDRVDVELRALGPAVALPCGAPDRALVASGLRVADGRVQDLAARPVDIDAVLVLELEDEEVTILVATFDVVGRAMPVDGPELRLVPDGTVAVAAAGLRDRARVHARLLDPDDGSEPLGSVRADRDGRVVMLLEIPPTLPEGMDVLTLRTRRP
jgi:hypothetical protein